MILICAACFLTFITLGPGIAGADDPGWWNSSYGYRERLAVTNSDAATLLAGYSVHFSLDHLALADSGKSLDDGDDIRVVYWNGAAYVELDRINESKWSTMGTNAQIWFKTQADLAGNGTDDNYFLYYGDMNATAPPHDWRNVYEFFEAFSDCAPGKYDTSMPGITDVIRHGSEEVWKIKSGTWNIENDTQADGTIGKVLSSDALSGLYTYAYLLNKDYGNVVVEVKMRTKEGETAGYWPFGARLNTSTGANYTAWSYNTYTKILEFSSWPSFSTLVSGTNHTGMGNNWHTFQLFLDGAKMNLTFDGASYGCYVEDSTLASGAVFAMGSANRKVHFDDFKVRRYTTNEPNVSVGTEEKLYARPIVTLDKKWRLKGDGYTPTDKYLGVTVNSPEVANEMPEAQASYEILGTGQTGTLTKTSPTTWRDSIDISNLPTGSFHLSVTLADSSQQWVSDPAVFRVSYPFYHVWTIDWEGGNVAKFPYLDSLAMLADEHGTPMSQLFNPYIYINPGITEWSRGQMTQWVLQRAQDKGDEIGLHLHMYTSFVYAAGIAPIPDPHWADRTDGYDVPFANYGYDQSVALLNLGIALSQARGLGRPTTFRAGGWFADEDNLKAVSDLGFLADASGGVSGMMGTLPNGWQLTVTSQPYYPCAGNKNVAQCSAEDWNLAMLEIPNNLSHTDAFVDPRPNFDENYSGAPLSSVGVGVLLSHDVSGVGAERQLLEQYFAHVDNFLYVADRGAVIYTTLAHVEQALSNPIPDPPVLEGALELVSGQSIPTVDASFLFDVSSRDTIGRVGYRIQISQSQDYDPVGIVLDYLSGSIAPGQANFSLVQPESIGTYMKGAELRDLPPGSYYWRVLALDSHGRSSRWSRARNGDMAFMVTIPEGIDQTAVPAVPLAVSFNNPAGPSVFFSAQLPVAGAATLRIFNCSGRLVRSLPLESVQAGAIRLHWDGRDSGGRSVSSGVYFVELNQDKKTVIKKLVIVR